MSCTDEGKENKAIWCMCVIKVHDSCLNHQGGEQLGLQHKYTLLNIDLTSFPLNHLRIPPSLVSSFSSASSLHLFHFDSPTSGFLVAYLMVRHLVYVILFFLIYHVL